jgi:hypothetical protein
MIEMTVRREISNLTPSAAWEGFVGSQTPQEFMDISRQRGYETVVAAVAAYVAEATDIFGDLTDQERETAAELLTQYIEDDAPKQASRERSMILALCTEAGDDVSDPDEVEAGFRINHHPDDIRAAADGDVAVLLRLRHACGLPVTR